MRRFQVIACAALVTVATFATLRTPLVAAPPTPVLVELFTSEGCSSCPPADQLLARMADAAHVDGALLVPLGEHVDYWDQLGWRDRFSSAAYTARQQAYAQRFAGDGPYTPQLVIDGRSDCVGSDAASARRLLAKAASIPHGTIAIDTGGATGSSIHVVVRASNLPQSPTDRAEVLVAITEDRLRTDVTRGENHGRTLVHAAVVRRLDVAGVATGSAATAEHTTTIAPDWRRDALHVVAFVQQRHAGPVLAAASVPLVPRP
jgi:hypothetical protein